MSDERRASVCGDPVEPAVADEPSVPGDDLHPHETSVEDHEGDEGPKDESEPAPVLEPPSVKDYPLLIFTTECNYNTDIKCNKCEMPVTFTLKMTPDGQEIPYHVIFESEVEQEGRKVKSQVIGACGLASLDDQ